MKNLVCKHDNFVTKKRLRQIYHGNQLNFILTATNRHKKHLICVGSDTLSGRVVGAWYVASKPVYVCCRGPDSEAMTPKFVMVL